MVSLTFSTWSDPPARLTPSVTAAPGLYLAISAAPFSAGGEMGGEAADFFAGYAAGASGYHSFTLI